MTPMPRLTRRRFLASSAAAACLGALPQFAAGTALAAAPRRLTAARRVLEVNGKPASVFSLTGADGTPGLVLDPGERFAVTLANRTGEETIIHWHGQTPPVAEDGVTDTGFAVPIPDGGEAAYDFAARPGTHWMHSHHGLQEQLLLAAPLVVRTAEDAAADLQEIAVLFHDFTFRDPAEILSGLTGGAGGHAGHGAPAREAAPAGEGAHAGHGGHAMNHGGLDLHDVEFDAYLANDRTLDDPELHRVERDGRVRLRLINGATATAFWIDLGRLVGSVVAVDGNPVVPVTAWRFPMSPGQRLDIVVSLPGAGAWPVIAQREGDFPRTGFILATAGATVSKLAPVAETRVPPADLSLDARLAAAGGLAPRPADVTHRLRLTGSMMPYVWSFEDRVWGEHLPLAVRTGQRVVVEMENRSGMPHPMHLHGHHFQVVGLGGTPVAGAIRDTVLVPNGTTIAIAFDADNPGRWLLHCHNLYHMASGMMTEVRYEG